MKLDSTEYKIYANHRFIEKYEERQLRIKIVAGTGILFDLCNCIGTIISKKRVDVSSVVLLILCVLLAFICFAFDVKCAKKIKAYEFLNYDLESEALKRKLKIAEIRKEILSDNIINKEIAEPVSEIIYPFNYYIVIVFLNIIIGLVMFFVV